MLYALLTDCFFFIFRQIIPCASGVFYAQPYEQRSRDDSIDGDSETLYLSSSGNVSDFHAERESSINSDLSFPRIARFIYRCVNCEHFSFNEEKINFHVSMMHPVNKNFPENLMPQPDSSVTIRIRSNDELDPDKYKISGRYMCTECPYVTYCYQEFFSHINIHSWLKDVRINAGIPEEALQPIEQN